MLPEPVRDWLKPYQGFGTLPAANVGVRRGHLWTVDHLACLLQSAQLSGGACMGPPHRKGDTPGRSPSSVAGCVEAIRPSLQAVRNPTTQAVRDPINAEFPRSPHAQNYCHHGRVRAP